MLVFIFVLKILAMILITNTHMVGVYPYDILASGGLLGDVIFFAVTGYLSANLKNKNFKGWYSGRIVRIYLPVIIATLTFLLLGFYDLKSMNIFQYFIYPTYYHFVASIMIIYIPFYFVFKYDVLRKKINWILIGILFVQLLTYLFFVDKTVYGIDKVREPFIRFLFGYSMFIGGYFRINQDKFINKFKWYNVASVILLLFVYLISKLFFLKTQTFISLQILNQYILMLLLIQIFKLFMSLEQVFKNKLGEYTKILAYISSLTLEVYIVQYVIIDVFKHLVFPINFIIIVVIIIITSMILNFIVNKLKLYSYKLINSIKREKEVEQL